MPEFLGLVGIFPTMPEFLGLVGVFPTIGTNFIFKPQPKQSFWFLRSGITFLVIHSQKFSPRDVLAPRRFQNNKQKLRRQDTTFVFLRVCVVKGPGEQSHLVIVKGLSH